MRLVNENAPAGGQPAKDANVSGRLNGNYSSTDTAAHLAENGIPVFPVNLSEPNADGKREKTPLTKHGHLDATTDAETVRQWWRRWPKAIPAVPTGKASGIDALDVDPDGYEWAAEHSDSLMMAQRIHHTERGKHYLFRHTDGVRNSNGKISAGIDVRGEGGWIVWWPAKGLEAHGELADVSDAPEALADLMRGVRSSTERDSAPVAADGAVIPEGQRDNTLTREAGRLRRYGYSESEMLAALHAINSHRCQPPLDADQVEKIARSVGRYDPAHEFTPDSDEPASPEPFDLVAASVGDLIRTPPPPRRWLVHERLPLDVVALLAAAGGTGKSMATLQLAVSMATGWPWFDMEISEPGAVLMVSAEDDRDEIHRRLSVVLEHYADDADPFAVDAFSEYHDRLQRRLFILDRVGEDNRLTAKIDRETLRTAFADRVVATAEAMPEPPVMIVLDPLSRFDGGDPNDNSDGTRLIEAAEHIRKATRATVLLPHHVAKSSMKDSSAGQEAVRGASGLVDGARWVGLMRGMNDEDAKEHGISEDDAGRYVRFNTPKANYSAPWPGLWLERRKGGVLAATHLKPQKLANKERKADAEYQEVVRRITKLLQDKGAMPKRRIEDEWGGTTNVLKAGQKRVRDTIHRALDEGHLVVQTTHEGKEVIGVPDTWLERAGQ